MRFTRRGGAFPVIRGGVSWSGEGRSLFADVPTDECLNAYFYRRGVEEVAELRCATAEYRPGFTSRRYRGGRAREGIEFGDWCAIAFVAQLPALDIAIRGGVETVRGQGVGHQD